jgi:hypothetical protein
MKVYFGSGENLNLSNTCNVLDEKFKDKTLRLMDLLKNKDKVCLLFICGNFVKPPEKKYFPISKRVLRLTEILKNGCFGEYDSPLEITNYDANFINPVINIKTNVFVMDEPDNILLNLLHQSLLLNYFPVYCNLEFMKERKLIFRSKENYLIIFVVNSEIFANKESFDSLEESCSHYAKQENIHNNRIKIGLMITGITKIGVGNIELKSQTAFDFVIISDADFTNKTEFEFFKLNKNFTSNRFDKFILLNLHFKGKIQVSRHFVMDYVESQINFKIGYERFKEDVREFNVPKRLVISDEYVSERMKELLVGLPKDRKVKVKFFYDYTNTFDIRNKDSLEKSLKSRVTNPGRFFYLKKIDQPKPQKLDTFNSLNKKDQILDDFGERKEVTTPRSASQFHTQDKKYRVLSIDSQKRKDDATINMETQKKIKKAFQNRTVAKAKNYIDRIKCPFN